MEVHELLKFDYDMFLRIITAVLLGFAIGLERELTNKYAGLRTHLLVCLGSDLFTILSIYAFPMAVESLNPQGYGDPARIAAQILTGIGFIGGGTVLRHGESVSGLTTAATLWVAASIGMACGAGLTYIALISTVFTVGVLILIRSFEKNVLVHSTKNLKKLNVIISCDNDISDEIHTYILDNFDYINEITKEVDTENSSATNIMAKIEVYNKKQVQNLYENFGDKSGINSITIDRKSTRLNSSHQIISY